MFLERTLDWPKSKWPKQPTLLQLGESPNSTWKPLKKSQHRALPGISWTHCCLKEEVYNLCIISSIYLDLTKLTSAQRTFSSIFVQFNIESFYICYFSKYFLLHTIKWRLKFSTFWFSKPILKYFWSKFMFLSSKAEVFYLIFGKVTTIGFCKNARKVNSENSILRIQSKKRT